MRARTYAGQIDDSRRSDQHSNRGETFDIYRRRRVNTISVQRERSFLLLGSTTLEEARDTLLRCSKLVDVTSSLFITTAAELRARSATSTGDRVETHIYVVIVCFFSSFSFFFIYMPIYEKGSYLQKRKSDRVREFALLFTFRDVSINLRESAFSLAKKKKSPPRRFETPARTNDPFADPLAFFSETFVDEQETKNGGKKGKKYKNKEIDRTCIVATTYRPKSVASDGWYSEKKFEMIDDRPILVATYGVAYPPACSYNGRRRNLFPRAGDVTPLMSLESKFLLNDSRIYTKDVYTTARERLLLTQRPFYGDFRRINQGLVTRETSRKENREADVPVKRINERNRRGTPFGFTVSTLFQTSVKSCYSSFVWVVMGGMAFVQRVLLIFSIFISYTAFRARYEKRKPFYVKYKCKICSVKKQIELSSTVCIY